MLKATGWKDKNEMKAKIEEVLKKVGMGSKGFKYPHQISGGEQQRIAIARALLNDPELIIADEPTGNLDPKLSLEIIKLFEEFNDLGVAVLIATHDLGLIARLKYRTLTLKQGAMINDGLMEGLQGVHDDA